MIATEQRGSVTVVRMAHGKANALDIELLGGIGAALDEAGTRPIVLTGTGTIFSAGVDLVRLCAEGPDYPRRFVPALCALFRKLLLHPRPLVAAVNGHAIAGGCVIACGCDRRILARGTARMGVTELLVGVPYPAIAMEILRARLTGRAFEEALLTGATYTPEDSLTMGFVDELAESAAVLDRSVGIAERLGSIPAAAYALTKRQMREPVIATVDRMNPLESEVRALWESPGTLEAVRSYVERTLKKPTRSLTTPAAGDA